MNIRPLGPEGVRARIAELQSRLDDVLGGQFDQTMTEMAPLAETLLRGGIGGRPADGLKPLDPFGASWNAPTADAAMRGKIRDAASRYGVDPDLFDALVAAESAYDPAARSRAGALGLTQLMPTTAQSLGVDPMNPDQNLDGGARYLAQMIRRFGDARTALAAYNAGPGAVEKHGGIPPYAETQAYIDKVMHLYQQRRGR